MPSFLEQQHSYDTILTYKTGQFAQNNTALSKILKSLKPGGKFVICQPDKQELVAEYDLITNGFVNVNISKDITCKKPNYEVGSSTKLNLKSKVANVWKLDDTEDENVETIDPDNLLDEEDFKKPDPSSLRGKLQYKFISKPIKFLSF